MKKLTSLVFLAVFTLGVPFQAFAATKSTTTVAKATTCAECRSRAEGADVAGARATSWKGMVIGINEGASGIVITDATKLNHIKAFDQRYVVISDDTDIYFKDESKEFHDIDIGYRVEVKGVYDAKQRIIKASSVVFIEIPNKPVTQTK